MSSAQPVKTYRVYQIRIKNGHRLFSYCDAICFQAKNLYNAANFYVRQLFSGLRKEENQWQALETQAIDTLLSHLPAMNQVKLRQVEKRRANEARKPKEKRKPIADAVLFEMPTAEKPFLSYGMLDALFKAMKQADYTALPGQVNQKVLRMLMADWFSFFEGIKQYRQHSERFSGRPKPPRYANKNGRKRVAYSNQICQIKGRYLTFPKTKLRLNIGKLGLSGIRLQEVRIVPAYGEYLVEIAYETEQPQPLTNTASRVMGIDLGVNNFAAITSNTGNRPVIIRGRVLKSINQFYNKQRAKYYGILRNGLTQKQGSFTSRRLLRLDAIRHRKVKDFLHKASFRVVELAKQWGIDTLVIGKNDDWKQNVQMRKANKLTFVFLPFAWFMDMVAYKAEQAGIRVMITEESYTSQANFLLDDPLPTYGKSEAKPAFQGKRTKRGLYKSVCGRIFNADLNGAANIIRKAVADAFLGRGDRGVAVSTPLVVNVR
jgi:putative transposase